MNNETIALIDRLVDGWHTGATPAREDLIALLELPDECEEVLYLRQRAHALTMAQSQGRGYLWAAIGLDFVACTMNCEFCSLGEKWNIVKDEYEFTFDEICAQARIFAAHQVDYITLRSTEFYEVKRMGELARKLREAVPGSYKIFVNIGELDVDQASYLHECGVFGAYHTLRLREGTDTPFDPAVRLATMQAITDSPLKLACNIEPVGPEHTAAEIADAILTLASFDPFIAGAHSRVPVAGTPLGDSVQVSAEKMAHIIAVARLAYGQATNAVCYGRPDDLGYASGGNLICFGMGASPRHTELLRECEDGSSTEQAQARLHNAGWLLQCDL